MPSPRSTARLAAGLILLALWAAPASADHRIVVPVGGGPEGSSSTFQAASGDGAKVLFSTNQPLLPEDTDEVGDLYLREGGRLTLVSAGGGLEDPQPAQFKAATPTLSHIVWESGEDITGTDFDQGNPDLYVTENGTEVRQVTQSGFGGFGPVNPILNVRISPDGAHIVFQTNQVLTFPTENDATDDVYENFDGIVRLLSPGSASPVTLRGISADGSRVFLSTDGDVAGAVDGDGQADVYERVNGSTTNLLTPGTAAPAQWAGLSAGGTHVFFHTTESLDAADGDARRDVYAAAGGAITLISTSATGGNGDLDASFQRSSADGSRVLFTTREKLDPADTDGDADPAEALDDIYLREDSTTTLITGGTTLEGEQLVLSDMTPDGQHVFWYSSSSYAGDDDGGFLDAWHWTDGTISRVSVGEQNDQGDHDSEYAGRSGDLSRLYFQSDGQLAAGDTDGFDDIYERSGGTTRLVTPATEPCTLLPSTRCAPRFMGASQDGARVWFESDENLHPADGDHATDVYEARYVGVPEVVADPSTHAYVEGDPAPVDPSLTVSEASDDLFGATVEITSGFEASDVLGFADLPGITGSLNGAGDTLTLTGRGTAADFQAALQSVTYTTTSETPSAAPRIVKFTVDNGGHTGSATRTLTVVPGNDAPVVDPGPSAGDYVEGAGPVVIGSEIAVSDADSPQLAGATVRIADGFAAGEDVLAFTAAGGITGAQDGDTLTLSGTAALADYQAVLRSVTYENAAEDPTEGTRLFEFAVSDGDRQSNPVYHATGVFRRTIDATNAALAYVENAPATAVDPGVTITNFPFELVQGASVEITEGFAAGEDQLAFADTDKIAGTLSAGGRKLTLTGEATVEEYVAALRSVTYRNTSDAPSGADRVIAFAVVDGLGSDARRVDVAPVDDAPLLVAGPAGAPFEENGLPAVIAAELAATDVDSATLTGAAVRIESGYDSGQDELTTTDKLPDGILGSWDAAAATLTLSGSAPLADYVAALRSIALYSYAEAPPTAPRVVSFTLSSAGATSAAVTQKIGVTAVNDVPVVDLAGADVAYVPGEPAVPVDGGVQLEDPDSDIRGATVVLAGGQQEGEDVLSVEDADDGIAVAVDPSEQSITFSGAASVAAYRTALRAVRYENRSAAATGTRVVSVQVDDGTDLSVPATRTIVLGTAAPASISAPAVTGVARVGGLLTGSTGEWSGSEPMTFARQWQRCAAAGDCVDIDGATGATYAAAAADVGAQLRLRVVADNAVEGTVAAVSPLTATVREALAAPVFTAGPAALVADDDAVVRFTGEAGAAFSCALDGGPFADCSAPVSLAGLADGEHVLRVRQTREGLTSGEAERRWTVDTVAPIAPRLLAGPDPVTVSRTAAVSFAGQPGETFQCALDGAEFAGCASPLALSGLEPGGHVLLVRALDAAGNAGAPLRVRWTVGGVVAAGLARTLTVRAPSAISRRARTFEAGCALDAGVLQRCEVIARVRRRGHLVRIGRGIVAPTTTGRSAAVRVRLTAAGRRVLRRAGRNARVRLTGIALQAGSPNNLIDVANTRAR